ncbi:unnamed protein product [Pleuronectes platessa]|uniref:Uncharacterized protein n=1 Tax=Pleuronectes platessa TaxID=8262 RepID=A0A9N7Y5F9_PLEPL|nr:unnamed protein product [Pleuronectes platessa]
MVLLEPRVRRFQLLLSSLERFHTFHKFLFCSSSSALVSRLEPPGGAHATRRRSRHQEELTPPGGIFSRSCCVQRPELKVTEATSSHRQPPGRHFSQSDGYHSDPPPPPHTPPPSTPPRSDVTPNWAKLPSPPAILGAPPTYGRIIWEEAGLSPPSSVRVRPQTPTTRGAWGGGTTDASKRCGTMTTCRSKN